jgi:hypothetical protein
MFGNLVTVLRYGSEVNNVEAWKKGGIAVSFVTALLALVFGALRHYGVVSVSVDTPQLADAASGLVTFIGVLVGVFTAATSARAGVLPAKGGADVSVEQGADSRRDPGT